MDGVDAEIEDTTANTSRILKRRCHSIEEDGDVTSKKQPKSTPETDPHEEPIQPTDVIGELKCIITETAFKNRIYSSIIENSLGIIDPDAFLEACKPLVIDEIHKGLASYKSGIKIGGSLACQYIIMTPDNETIERFNFNSKMEVILQSTNSSEWYENKFKIPITSHLNTFESKSSSKALYRIESLCLYACQYDALNGGTYHETPAFIKSRRATINIRNKDNRCFGYSMLAAKFPSLRNRCRLSSYNGFDMFKEFNFKGINFPVSLHDIEIFEKQNNEISINVYGIDGKSIILMHQTNEQKLNHVNLLMIESHYCLITDLSRLLGRQISMHTRKKLFCESCNTCFSNEEWLKKHKLRCMKSQIITMPELGKNDILEFNAYGKCMRVPFTIYADIESMLVKVHSCQPDTSDSWTRSTHIHEPVSISLHLVCSYDDSLTKFKIFTGPHAIEDFLKELTVIAEEVINIYADKKDIIMTEKDELDFINAKQCHICNREFSDDSLKVRDHDHLSSRFIGSAHVACNLNRKLPNFIPIFFHCLSKYDAHFIVKKLSYDNEPITCISQTSENYLSFSKRCTANGKHIYLRFLDSYRFLDTKLADLSGMLQASDFRYTNKEYTNPVQRNLMTRKGVFPYTYLDCRAKLSETSLPDKDCFDNITDEDYIHAITVWNEFGISNIAEYLNLYLKTDTLLLTDIFEKFRDLCIEMYTLDPSQYYTAPGLSYDAMLKITKVRISLITDQSMLEFFESAIRGGLCVVSKRYAKANNKYMSVYNDSLPTKFLSYVDCNGLYSSVMKDNALPYTELRWLTEAEINSIDFMSVEPDSDTGYVLEVDLEYPQNIHDWHNDLPLCPQSEIVQGDKYSKLLATLRNKDKYILHYRTLQQCIELGLKLTQIHRVVAYKQSFWLKTYIDLNAKKRIEAKTKFGQNLWKKMNNCVYGKFMENVRRYNSFHLVTSWKQARKLMARQTCIRYVIFEENLVGVELAREEIQMLKPIYIGQAILDLSKHLMYDFYYNTLKKHLNDVVLNYTDTDSFIFETSSDVYEFIKEHIHLFDTSNYPPDNVYNIPLRNKKIAGLFKDELSGRVMDEYIGLRSKLYCYRYDGQIIKKSKGITHDAMRTITFDDYLACLNDMNVTRYARQNCFRSYKHIIHTIESNKAALRGFDTKRYIQDNSFTTLAWGHYAIPQKDQLI